MTDFAARYDSAFARYLRQGEEGDLQAAYELGREAVVRELSVLDLAAIHHESLLAALQATGDVKQVEKVTVAGADFFMESLSAFEIVRRSFRETQEAALVERKQASILRRLSSFLGDTSLALAPGESVDEALQLVAEHAREVLGAACCTVAVDDGETNIVSCSAEEDTWMELVAADLTRIYDASRSAHGVVRMSEETLKADALCRALPQTSWLAVPLRLLDGTELGVLHLFGKLGGDFSELDEAVAIQLAQMTAAALERARLYGRETVTPPASSRD